MSMNYRMMKVLIRLRHGSSESVAARVEQFGIAEGSTVVDYGCGPGRYTQFLAEKVGEAGTVYAVDIEPGAVKDIRRIAEKRGWHNVIPVLAKGYTSEVPFEAADMVFALDMFHIVDSPELLVKELARIVKPDGIVLIDYGHQPKEDALEKISRAGILDIVDSTDKCALCKKRV